MIPNHRKGLPRNILSPYQIHEIVRRYKAGEKYRILAADFGVSDSCIWKVVSTRGAKMDRREVSDLEIAHARNYCRQARIIRPGATSHVPASTTSRRGVDEFAFDIVTPEAAYWLGFLMADGSVQNGVRHSLKIQLATIDGCHVRKFRDFLKSGHKISVRPPRTFMSPSISDKPINDSGSYSIVIHSHRLADVVCQYGVVPNKSHVATVQKIASHPDFWRGVVDGDGHIGAVRKQGFGVCGSFSLMVQFSEFCQKIAPGAKRTMRKTKNTYYISHHGKNAAIILDALYNFDGPALNRKRANAMLYLSHYQNLL